MVGFYIKVEFVTLFNSSLSSRSSYRLASEHRQCSSQSKIHCKIYTEMTHIYINNPLIWHVLDHSVTVSLFDNFHLKEKKIFDYIFDIFFFIKKVKVFIKH